MAGSDATDAPTGAITPDEGKAQEVLGKSLKCPQCGAPWTLRGFAATRTLACEYCGTILDTSKPEWEIVQHVERKRQTAALWPLGQKGRFSGKSFQLVGWMERYVEVDRVQYKWEEHLFFNPYYGFRYLIHQDGHFQLVEPLPGFPIVVHAGSSASQYTATYDQVVHRHFTSGMAHVSDVVGEFPWRVRRGETVTGYDFVAPPAMLSCEESGLEVVWSRGVYMTQDEVWAAVGPPKRPTRFPKGVYPNQPNPYSRLDWLWKASGGVFVLWLLLSCVYFGRSEEKTVLDVSVPPKPKPAATPTPEATPGPYATPPAAEAPATPGHTVYDIVLDSRRDPAVLEIQGSAPVSNSYAWCEGLLVDASHEHAYPFALEMSYYEGIDDGERWSEGSKETTVDLGAIPNGKYVLQVERGDNDAGVPIHLVVKRDVALVRYPCCSLLLFILFPLIVLVLRTRFETRRWAESDHAPGG